MNFERKRPFAADTTSRDIGAIWAGALLVVYLIATLALLTVRGVGSNGALVALHVAVLAAVSATVFARPVPTWLRTWAPIIAILFLYTEMPALIRAAGHATTFDATVIRWEQGWFHSQPARDWHARLPSAFLSELLHLCYLAYYPIIVIVAGILEIQRRRREQVEAVFVLMLAFIMCSTCYLFFPVAGPRYVWHASWDGAPHPIRSMTLALLEARSSRGTAFPSSHVAVAICQSLLAMRYFGARGLPVLVVSLLLAAGAVYGGFHYAVDVVAGATVGLVAFVGGGIAFRALSRRWGPYANATAPT